MSGGDWRDALSRLLRERYPDAFEGSRRAYGEAITRRVIKERLDRLERDHDYGKHREPVSRCFFCYVEYFSLFEMGMQRAIGSRRTRTAEELFRK